MKFTKTTKLIILSILGVLAVFFILGMLGIFFVYRFENPGAFAAGLFGGGAVCIINAIAREKAFNKLVDMEGNGAKLRSFFYYILRMANVIVFAVLLVKIPHIFGLWGAVSGLLSAQPAAYIAGYISGKYNIY